MNDIFKDQKIKNFIRLLLERKTKIIMHSRELCREY